MKTAYYAHCMAIYGTPQEERDHQLIRQLGYEPVLFGEYTEAAVNDAKRRGRNVMDEVFRPMVEGCSILFFRALPDGRISSGVVAEIGYARAAGIPVLELPSNVGGRAMTATQTVNYLYEVGQR